MKKVLLGLAALACLSFAADGEAVYKKCIACHGQKADTVYLGKVPALNTFDKDYIVSNMKAYKEGTVEGGKGKFAMGAVMKAQMATVSEEDMNAVADYIQTLK